MRAKFGVIRLYALHIQKLAHERGGRPAFEPNQQKQASARHRFCLRFRMLKSNGEQLGRSIETRLQTFLFHSKKRYKNRECLGG